MQSKCLPICLLVLALIHVAAATGPRSHDHSSPIAGRNSSQGANLLRPSSPDDWLGGTGNWGNGSDWSGGLPGSGSDVTIYTGNDYVTLDTSSNINSLTVGGPSGFPGNSTLIGDGNPHTLNVAGSLTVGHSGFLQLVNDTATAGSVSVSGYLFLNQGSTMTVNGDVTTISGGSLETGAAGSRPNTLNVSGTVMNGGGFAVLGQGDVANVGRLINHGGVEIGTGATLNLTNQSGLTDIASDADYQVQGTFTAQGHSALANLTTLEGALVLINGQNTDVTPVGGTLTLTDNGGYHAQLLLFQGTSLHVNGDLNAISGGIAVGIPQLLDSNGLYISGALTLNHGSELQISGENSVVSARSLNVMNGAILATYGNGTLRVGGDVINGGCIGYCGGDGGGNTFDIGGTFNNTSTGNFSAVANDQMNAAAVVNSGFMRFLADSRLNVGSLTLNPGSYLDIGLDGPNSFGMILATGTVALNGELHVTLSGYDPPVGQEFKFLTFTPGALSGTFSGVSSNGENFAVDYNDAGGYAELIAEGNGGTVPEPGSLMLFGSGVLGMAAVVRRRVGV